MVDKDERTKQDSSQRLSDTIFKLTFLSHAMKARGVQGEDSWLFSSTNDYWALGNFLGDIAGDLQTIGRELYGAAE